MEIWLYTGSTHRHTLIPHIHMTCPPTHNPTTHLYRFRIVIGSFVCPWALCLQPSPTVTGVMCFVHSRVHRIKEQAIYNWKNSHINISSPISGTTFYYYYYCCVSVPQIIIITTLDCLFCSANNSSRSLLYRDHQMILLSWGKHHGLPVTATIKVQKYLSVL